MQRLIGYTTGEGQREEIERAGSDWRVAGWVEESPGAPLAVAARPGFRGATARLIRGEADGLVVRSLADVSDLPIQHAVVDWCLHLDARFIALADGLDTHTPEGRRRADTIVREAGLALRKLPRPGWEARNEVVARYIAPGSSVLDLGAGACPLQRLVETDRYVAADRATWRLDADGRPSLWWDPDLGVWPAFDSRFDVAVLSGVAEYLADLDSVLARVARLADRLVITYSTLGSLTFDELRELLNRRASSWSEVDRWQAHRIFTAVLAPFG